ncbi:MAG TPA: basic amino acid ABC transporter substrate-binding protein [Egibacteraceae bacterium]|nr:basic amino acid ABC transporter substrate-binding protein [Egibacteraceae bacterium]
MKLGMRWLLALAAVMALLLTACGDAAEEEPQGDDTDTETENEGGDDLGLIQEGRLLVGSDINFAPFEFIEDGEEKGFDIDLMNEIAERLGLEVEYVNTGFDNIFTQLAGGEFDVIVSAITITDERKEIIAFSEPYFEANQALVTTQDSGISGVADLAGKDVGTQAGTTGLDYARENFTDASIVEFPDAPAGFTALAAGQLDAMFIDVPVAVEQVEGNDDFVLVEEVSTNELYGIGVQQDDAALLEAIDAALAEIIADGTYAEIFETWFPGAQVPDRFATDGAS